MFQLNSNFEKAICFYKTKNQQIIATSITSAAGNARQDIRVGFFI